MEIEKENVKFIVELWDIYKDDYKDILFEDQYEKLEQICDELRKKLTIENYKSL